MVDDLPPALRFGAGKNSRRTGRQAGPCEDREQCGPIYSGQAFFWMTSTKSVRTKPGTK